MMRLHLLISRVCVSGTPTSSPTSLPCASRCWNDGRASCIQVIASRHNFNGSPDVR